jgi:DNA-directed RNA polymerase specialized sigma24 family protein
MRSHADVEDRPQRNRGPRAGSHSERPSGSPSALPYFVLATARNVIREFGRRGRRAEPERDFPAATAGGVDHAVTRAIESIIGRLKPREREFLRPYYSDELTKTEIGRRLGIQEDRRRLIKSRALQSFGEIYGRLVK